MSYVEVRVISGDKHLASLDAAIKEFKKRVKKDEILQDLKKHEFYMSPSNKKRWKKNEAFKRKKREERKQQWNDKNPNKSVEGDEFE